MDGPPIFDAWEIEIKERPNAVSNRFHPNEKWFGRFVKPVGPDPYRSEVDLQRDRVSLEEPVLETIEPRRGDSRAPRAAVHSTSPSPSTRSAASTMR